MTWFKSIWTASGTAILAVLAIFAVMSAQRSKSQKEKWQQTALDIEAGNVKRGTQTAGQANIKAQIHDQKAKDRDQKAKDRMKQIGDSNESVSAVLDAFRSSS